MSTNTADLKVIPSSRQITPPVLMGVMKANKPVVGARSASGKSTSSLFYWSHSRFLDDFEFGLHSHEGFEIATFILEGENSHYDTATKEWFELKAGDVQIIRSGSGISHNERVAKGARAFQIWFDPDYDAALQKSPTYTDYTSAMPKPSDEKETQTIDIIGGSGPVQAHTEDLRVFRVHVADGGTTTLSLGIDRLTIAYVISGEVTFNGNFASTDDMVELEGISSVDLVALSRADVFIVSVPMHPSYTPVRGH